MIIIIRVAIVAFLGVIVLVIITIIVTVIITLITIPIVIDTRYHRGL